MSRRRFLRNDRPSKDPIRIRDLAIDRVNAAVLEGWRRLSAEQLERLGQLLDRDGRFENRWDFSAPGRLRVWWGDDILVADLPIRDYLAGEPRLDA